MLFRSLYLISAAQDRSRASRLLKEVKELSDKLIVQNPNSFDGHRLSGQVALLNRDTKTAVVEFEQANRTKPYQTDLVLAYVQALAGENQFASAEKLAYDLIAREKTYAPIYDILYLYYARQKRLPDASRSDLNGKFPHIR